MATNVLQDLLHALTLRDPRARRRTRRRTQPVTPQRVLDECARLLDSDGEASSISLAISVFDLYAALADTASTQAFFLSLCDQFAADSEAVDQAYEAYKNSRDNDALQRLFKVCEPPRQELLRRLNLAPGGTRDLVRMREDLLSLLRDHPELAVVNDDFDHLFSSWFNRGFLVLRRVDWDTPASILEKLIRYEAVHAIRDWDDLRRRLDPGDRRCFAFFHPALADDPLIFVEVALAKTLPDNSQQVTCADTSDDISDTATIAAFYGISNCQPGLRGISFGNFLLKQVVQEMKDELPQLDTFITLSPVPGFMQWLRTLHNDEPAEPAVSPEQQTALAALIAPEQHAVLSTDVLKNLGEALLPLAAWYLINAKNRHGLPLNPVARFHLRNGARLDRINWLGDRSDKNLRDGAGLMVNYRYDLDDIQKNHERLTNDGVVAVSRDVRRLARQVTEHKQGAHA